MGAAGAVEEAWWSEVAARRGTGLAELVGVADGFVMRARGFGGVATGGLLERVTASVMA